MLETVEENMKMFTKREIERAQAVRAAQRPMAHPTDKHFKQIVSQRSTKNLPCSTADIANAKTLYGPDVAGLKGRTTRKKVRGATVERVSIPEEFYRKNKFVTIAADVMFVSGVAFLSLTRRRLNS